MDKPKIAGLRSHHTTLEPGTYFWCACGLSKNQPFCDGSHQGTSFSPEMIQISEPTEVWLCNCKQSGNKPHCDGTHKQLPGYVPPPRK
ncbi:MAG: hypothetical protein Kow00127_25430 [Bacteroidales bacterium]